jgi:hypothetical protein
MWPGARFWRAAVCSVTAAVLIWRGAMLIAQPASAFDGVGEKKWFAWAYRRQDLRQRFAAVRTHSKDVVVVVPEAAPDPVWWRVMALYYLPQCDSVTIRGCPTCSQKDRLTVFPASRTRS